MWKLIPGFEPYEVNEIGIIRNGETKNTYSRYLTKDGYLFSVVKVNKANKTLRINRAVALAYIPNPGNKKHVNHKDGVKINNAISNLEWATPSENEKHSYKTLGKTPISHWKGKIDEMNPCSKPVNQFTLSGKLIKTYPSLSAAQRDGFSSSHISRVCSGKEVSHKKFIWKY